MKSKYQFNPEKLSYSIIDYSIWQKFLRFVLPQILAVFVIGFLIFISFDYFFDTPEERQLREENKFLASNAERMENKYEKAQKVLIDIQKRDENIYKAIFEAEPSSVFQNQMQINIDKYLEYPALQKANLLDENQLRLDTIEYKIKAKDKFYTDLFELIREKGALLAQIPAILPLKENIDKNAVYGFGKHLDPFYKSSVFHKGLDIAIPVGTPVVATGNGVVTQTLNERRQYGSHIIINHGNGYESLYANLDKIAVRPGKRVSRGEVIGYSGNSGKSAAPHLHYEVRKNGKAVNPANYIFLNITPEQFESFTFKASQPGQVLD
jgi:murein DD-endopeptidase MepM/ murein hydrolase activator NlpD